MNQNTVSGRFKERLDACATGGSLSTSDLAFWFDQSYATMRAWRQGTTPEPARRKQIGERLLMLENAVKIDPRLPVPLTVRAGERRAYLEGVRRAFV